MNNCNFIVGLIYREFSQIYQDLINIRIDKKDYTQNYSGLREVSREKNFIESKADIRIKCIMFGIYIPYKNEETFVDKF